MAVTTVFKNSIGTRWIVLDILGGLVPVIIDAATCPWDHPDQQLRPTPEHNSL
jgi:hypothetical protein